MMSVPAGIGILSAAETLLFLSDVADRVSSPCRLKDRTRYMLRRDAANGTVDEERQQQLAKLYPALAEGTAEEFGAKMRRYVRDFTRRDKISALFDDWEKMQDHHVCDSVLSEIRQTHELVKEVEVKLEIKPCTDARRATLLVKACKHVSLRGVVGTSSTRIFKTSDDRDDVPLPLWGVAPKHSRVTGTTRADGKAEKRLEVLLAVAVALQAAHEIGWAHRRLSMYTIVLVPADAGTELKNTKVLYFFNELTGCHGAGGSHDGCRECGRRVREIDEKPGVDFFQSERSNGKGALFYDNQKSALKNGQRHDVHSFSRFVLWMYSGKLLPPEEQLTLGEDEHAYEDAVACVPWPLRFLLYDADILHMDTIATYLRALSRNRNPITPHDTVYFPFTSNASQSGSSSTMERSGSESTLQELCVRSAVVAMRSAEPEAAMYLGYVMEKQALENLRRYPLRWDRESLSAEYAVGVGEKLELSHVCYKLASQLGEVAGIVGEARLLARELLDERFLLAYRRVELRRTALRLALRASVQGSTVARASLAAFAACGFHAFAEALGSSPEETVPAFATPWSVIRVITDIGCMFRRGRVAQDWKLKPDEDEARFWLDIASNRHHPRATLELGLLHVQMQSSPELMRVGVNLVAEAANAYPGEVALEAMFWLAHWHQHGLDRNGLHYNPEESSNGSTYTDLQNVVVAVDGDKAASYAQIGANDKHADCTLQVSQMMRVGLGPFEKNDMEAKRLRDLAVERGSDRARIVRAAGELDDAISSLEDYLCDVMSSSNTSSSSSESKRRSASLFRSQGNGSCPATVCSSTSSSPSERTARPGLRHRWQRRPSGENRDTSDCEWVYGKQFADLCGTLEGAIRELTGEGQKAIQRKRGGLDSSFELKTESLSPWPLSRAAGRLVGFLDRVGKLVDMSNEESEDVSGKLESFLDEKWVEALHLYDLVCSIDLDASREKKSWIYRETRIDWLSRDRAVIQDAQKRRDEAKRKQAHFKSQCKR
jgi:hypothetical protein